MITMESHDYIRSSHTFAAPPFFFFLLAASFT